MTIPHCCKHSNKRRLTKCRRKSDGKIFKLPRRFTRKKCKKGIKGFSARSSCAPYKDCIKKHKGGSKKHRAVAVIDMNNIKGNVFFYSSDDRCNIRYNIVGLSSGHHGFHVHTCGDLTKGCESGCSHFNPTNCHHGGPHSKTRHAGDLGNIYSSNGRATGTISVKNLSCNPKSDLSIIGRMIIIHQDKDDLGKGGDAESIKTGNAGKRIACAVIGLID